MNEGQEGNNRRSSVTGWAWTISIIVHLVVLGIFAVVKFSQWQEVEKQRPAPTARVSQVKRMVGAEPISPKPKVKKSIVSCSAIAAVNRPLPVKQIFDVPKPVFQNTQNISNPAKNALKGMLPLSSSTMASPKVEFFGNITEDRKICYVVDCSGSMQGIFARVQKELIKSIEGLDADRYFYVIFFGSGKLYEYGDGRLTRATAEAKAGVCEFIKLVRPAGTTNAMAAMERAMQIRDNSGAAPAIIYFLTDGFELTSDSAYRFAEEVKDARKNFAPVAKINTIGFWVQGWDGRVLERIAKQSGGKCTLIEN
jgi:hypothetical protein